MKPELIEEFRETFVPLVESGQLTARIEVGCFVENRFRIEMPLDREFRLLRQRMCMQRLRDKRRKEANE